MSSVKKKQIAIVEDNVKIRDLIQQFLNMQADMECRNAFQFGGEPACP